MKAVRMHGFGDADVLVYEDAPRPEASAGEVLVRVHAAGVNPADWQSRWGGDELLAPATLPLIPGWDVSGVVEAVGEGVTAFKVGDAVYGMARFPDWGSTYAEYVTCPTSDLSHKPRHFSHVEAAAIPLVALTAWQALFEAGDLQAGETVLIHAAAGGVGHMAVQLATWKGARVIGTASARNTDYLKGIGVDEVIDYTTTRFDEVLRDVDVVLDTMGGDIADRSFKVLRRGGRLVSIVATPSAELAVQYGVQTADILVHRDADQLAEITTLCEAEYLKATIDSVYPLAQATEAHRKGETNRTRGKLVLKVV
ncbi:MAG: NADP-dependent oxidoreductase [Chloroflexi bacterium]|nr:NADP-dependent oxidoreductase [Chloroflexota bacterium]MCC6895737.1 NADP-dependent oxidoreductase [Anaerolineae bacterium]